MKTAIKSTWIVARRMALHFQMRSLEQHIDGCDRCMECVADPLTRQRITVASSVARRELAKVRAAYNATFKPGVRNVWRTA